MSLLLFLLLFSLFRQRLCCLGQKVHAVNHARPLRRQHVLLPAVVVVVVNTFSFSSSVRGRRRQRRRRRETKLMLMLPLTPFYPLLSAQSGDKMNDFNSDEDDTITTTHDECARSFYVFSLFFLNLSLVSSSASCVLLARASSLNEHFSLLYI